MVTEPHINLAPLERANDRLGRFVARYAEIDEDHPDHDVFHTAVVKGFEFTYELAFNAILRYVDDYVLSPGRVGQMRIPDVLRAAAKNGLYESSEEWLIFRQRRNATSHEYLDENAIDQLVELAPEFNNAVDRLLIALRDRLE